MMPCNDVYWGPKPACDEGDVPAVDQHASRVAALMTGDVDMIEHPPNGDLRKLEWVLWLALAEAVSSRVIYLALDQLAEPSPIPHTDGKNPLKDKQVRQALSQAIDRKAIVDRIMEGVAVPAGDFLPFPAFGTSADTRARQVRSRPPPARCWPTQAIPTASRSLWARPTAATSTTSRWRRPWRRCGAGSAMKTEVEATEPPVFFKNRDEYQVQRLPRRLGRRSGRDVQPVARAGRHAELRERHGRQQPRPLSNSRWTPSSTEALRTVDDAKREAMLQEACGWCATSACPTCFNPHEPGSHTPRLIMRTARLPGVARSTDYAASPSSTCTRLTQ